MRGNVMRLLALAVSITLTAPAMAETAPAVQAPRLRALETSAPVLSQARQAEILTLLQTADIAALQQIMAAGQLTSVELTEFYLGRIMALDDGLRSYLELNPAALDEAKAADAARAKGDTGPLLGIPVSLKDNIETAAPMHTTANAAVLLDNVATGDAALVTGLRQAGAVILGKNSLSEFAGVVSHGTPEGGSGAVGGQAQNPHGAQFPTFGSSAGSAVATAALLTQVSVGTETSGSLIAPSMIAGVVALKPTHGLVSGQGVIPLIAHNDSAGPIGRSVADIAALLAAIDTTDADYTAGLTVTAFDGVMVGVLARDFAAQKQNTAVLAPASAILTALGAKLRPVELTDPSNTVPAFIALIGAGMRYDMMPYITARHSDLVSLEDLIAFNAADPTRRIPFGQDLLVTLAQISQGMEPEDFREFTAAISAGAAAGLDQAFADTGAEVLLSVASVSAPYYATAGYPAVTVPMGLRPDGAPWGVTLIGKAGTDARLLAFAYALEQATQARVTPAMARH